MMKHGMRLAGLLMFLALASPGWVANAEPAKQTAADYGIGLPDNLAASIPFPAEVEVGGQRQVIGTYYINFRFSLAWPAAVEFFAEGLPAAGWEITREQLPEQATGPRSAAWQARGHGAELGLSLQTAGGAEGSHSVGVLQVRSDRD